MKCKTCKELHGQCPRKKLGIAFNALLHKEAQTCKPKSTHERKKK